MKRVFFGYSVIFALGISFLAAYAPLDREPGLSSQRGLEQVGLDAGSTANEASDSLRIDLDAIGADLIAGEYWTPTVDFSGGNVYFFDPDATPGAGDGSWTNPFSSLAYEVSCDSTIERCDADDYVVDNAANGPVVGPGDVCVLLEGNHGWIRFLRYYNSDYIALVGAPGHDVTFDYLNFERYQRFYVENLSYSGKARYLRADAGTMTDAGYDTKPYMLYARRDSNGNGVAEYVIINDCDFSNGTAAQAAAWSETEWDSIVCDAMLFRYTENVHVQDCTGTALGAFAKFAGSGTDPEAIAIKFSKATLINNTYSHLSGDGIRASWGDSLHVVGNTAMDWYVPNADHIDMMQMPRYMNHVIVERNKMFHSTDPSRSPEDFGIVDGYAAGFSNSYEYGAVHNTVFRNNVLLVESWGGIHVHGGENITIVNNTVVGRDESGTADIPYVRSDSVSVNYNASGIVIANNIAGRAQHGIDATGVTTLNNIEGIRDFSTIGFTTFTQDGDPTLWDLHLSATSPAIRAGSSTYAPATDYEGNTRPDKVYDDIGAYVYDDPDATAPAQITDLAVQGYYDEVDLIWTASAAADLDYYNLYRGTSSGSLSLFDTIESGNQGDYSDSTVNTGGDSTYYYAIAAVDSSGNEAADSNEVSATPTQPALAWNSLSMTTPTIADTTSGGNAEPTMTAQLNRAGFLRPLWRRHNETYPDRTDTSGMAWMTADSAQVIWSGDYDSGVPIAAASEDSGGIRLTWSAGSGHDGYLLDMNVSTDGSTWGGWNLVSYIHPDSTGFTHAADDDTLTPRRGMLNYRLFGFSGTPGSETDSSAVALLDSVYYNQAVGVYGEFHAVEDTAEYYAGNETPTVSSEVSGLWTTPWTVPADTTPPDTTGVFVAVTIDTTNASDVLLTLSDMTIGEEAQVQFEWSNDGGSNYYGDSSWSPGTASTTVGDTIETGVSTENLNSDLYTRFRLRDDEGTPNVSGWNVNAQVFERAAEAASGPAWTGTVVWSNSSTLTGYPASPDYEETSGMYQAAINLYSSESSDTTTDWGYVNTSTDIPVYNHPYGAGAPDRFDLSQVASGRRVALLAFGQADSIQGGTVSSATLHIDNANFGSQSVDSVFVWSAQGSALTEWATESDDASWDYANTSETTAWSESLDNLTESDVLPYVAISGGDISDNTPWSVDVTDLLQEYADNGGTIVFLITATSDGTNGGELFVSIRPHDDGTASNRPFLEAEIAE